MNSLQVEPRDWGADAPSESRDEGQTTAEAAGSTPQETFPFDAMNLKVGDRLQVQPPATVSTERSPVKLIGYLQDQSLLITAPTTGGSVPMQVMPGDQLIMRVFSGQTRLVLPAMCSGCAGCPTATCTFPFPKKSRAP